jgi:hypothetical protein
MADLLSREHYLTEQELADLWGMKRNTLQKWRSLGVGPVFIKRIGRVVYRKDAILDFEKHNCFQGSGLRVEDMK